MRGVLTLSEGARRPEVRCLPEGLGVDAAVVRDEGRASYPGRLIQQAVHQVLGLVFGPGFSDAIRAYARARSVSHVAMLKAAKAGRIPLEPDGTIDPAKADPVWKRSTETG